MVWAAAARNDTRVLVPNSDSAASHRCAASPRCCPDGLSTRCAAPLAPAAERLAPSSRTQRPASARGPTFTDSPFTFDPLQYAFDQGSATGEPVCGVVDDFLTEAECSKLIDLATARGYESTEETIQHGGRKGRTNNKSVINISGKMRDRLAKLVREAPYRGQALGKRSRASPSMQPVKALLKQSNPGWTPVGLNSVFRFLRYGPGDYFRPHRDSHFVPEVNDARHGRVTSFQSLLLYSTRLTRAASPISRCRASAGQKRVPTARARARLRPRPHARRRFPGRGRQAPHPHGRRLRVPARHGAAGLGDGEDPSRRGTLRLVGRLKISSLVGLV